jgi:lipopolysaccharide transport protein LptA
MRTLATSAWLIFWFAIVPLPGQGVVAPNEPKKAEKASMPEKTANNILGVDPTLKPREPITTEVFADEAFFDSTKYIATFSGHVKVSDPRFNLQSDKLTIYVSKGANQGLEKAVAEGNVGVVRDRPDPNGGAATRAVGRSESAIYIASTGEVELKGSPRVQQGVNTHVATSPDTVMIINQNGQLTTHGPSRTDIRQQPDNANGEKKTEAPPGQ